MNTLEIDHVLKTHPSIRNVFKGEYARNKLPRRLNLPATLIGNTDPNDRPGTHWVALYIDANSKGEYYDPTGRPPCLKGIRELYEQTLYELDLQHHQNMRTPLYILSDTQMCRTIHGRCYENTETLERSHRNSQDLCASSYQ